MDYKTLKLQGKKNVEAMLKKKIKQENKGAIRELKRDAAFLANVKLQETKRSDKERKRKVNMIMHGLETQESEHKKVKLGAIKKK